MLRVLPPMFNPVNNLICCKTDFMWVVKRTTSLFNSFCSNVEKQAARFLLPVFPYLQTRGPSKICWMGSVLAFVILLTRLLSCSGTRRSSHDWNHALHSWSYCLDRHHLNLTRRKSMSNQRHALGCPVRQRCHYSLWAGYMTTCSLASIRSSARLVGHTLKGGRAA